MGCGCKDKERDAEIIAYHDRKMALKNAKVEMKVYEISWYGMLSEYFIHIHDESKIDKIEHRGDMWVATLKEPIK